MGGGTLRLPLSQGLRGTVVIRIKSCATYSVDAGRVCKPAKGAQPLTLSSRVTVLCAPC